MRLFPVSQRIARTERFRNGIFTAALEVKEEIPVKMVEAACL